MIRESFTLLKVVQHLTVESAPEELDFPFHLQNFCNEMDRLLTKIRKDLETLATHTKCRCPLCVEILTDYSVMTVL